MAQNHTHDLDRQGVDHTYELQNLDRTTPPIPEPEDVQHPTRLLLEPAAESPWKQRTRRQKILGGLPRTLQAFATLTAVILCINIGWIAWAKSKYGTQNGYGTIQQEDCNAARTLNTWLHLAINILSTALLLGSAAFVQAASSPSRDEINLAHQGKKWVSIGLMSLRNISALSIRKIIVCSVFFLSSIPLHLFYNSVIYSSTSANDYYWAVVTDEFLSGSPFNLTINEVDSFVFPVFGVNNETGPYVLNAPNNLQSTDEAYWTKAYEEIQNKAATYERLDNSNCIKAYSSKIVSNRRNLLLVSSDKNESNSVLEFDAAEVDNEGSTDQTNWICSQSPVAEDLTCDASLYLRNASVWTVFDHPIKYCLSEQSSEKCAVKFSYALAIVVIICNVAKLAAQVYFLCTANLKNEIVCIGDAIASFLEEEDLTTRDMCLTAVPSRSVQNVWARQGQSSQYHLTRPRWGSVVSRTRWLWTYLVMAIAVIVVLTLLLYSIDFIGSKGFSKSAQGLWALGFGTVDPEILIASDNFGSPDTLALLANLPQIILAFLFFMYNGIYTAVFAAHEYSLFAFQPRTLMVSSPVGDQRGTWLLGMPFTWGMMFLVIQVALHYFTSQALFVVDVTVFNEDGSVNTAFGSISNCGFSPLAMIFTLAAAALMMILTACLAMRKMKARATIPFGNCSAAISAACHPRECSEKLPYLHLKWGCIGTGIGVVGHCTFDEDVKNELLAQPLVGRYYMGSGEGDWPFEGSHDHLSDMAMTGLSID